MFLRNLVLLTSLCVLMFLGATLEGCTPNVAKVRAPEAPVAEPTVTASPSMESSQGPRHESQPVIPFDGSKPEVIVVPESSQSDATERVNQERDVYAELIGQSLTCEEASQ